MKSLRTLFAAVLMAASLIGGSANASLIGETIDGGAFIVIGSTPVPEPYFLDQTFATVGSGTEFSVFEGEFVSFDFAANTLTISFAPLIDNWLDWPTYTFSGFDQEILGFQLIDSAGIDPTSDLLKPGGYSFTPHSVTVKFGTGELLDGFSGAAYIVYRIPEPQSILLVLAALGLMGISMRRGRALPR